MREDLAYTIFVKLMNEHELAGLYDPSLSRLMAMTQQVHQWLAQNEPDLAQMFEDQGIPLSSVLAGPWMSIMATKLELNVCLQVLDNIIDNSNALVVFAKNAISRLKPELVARGELAG